MKGKKNSSIYLMEERPISCYPKLAQALGVDKALIVQQVRYWMGINAESSDRNERTNHFFDDRWWTYNTFEQWEDAFPWMRLRTIARHFAELQSDGILLKEFLHKDPLKRTGWYSIDFDMLDEIVERNLQKTKEELETCRSKRKVRQEKAAEIRKNQQSGNSLAIANKENNRSLIQSDDSRSCQVGSIRSCQVGSMDHANPAECITPTWHDDLYTETNGTESNLQRLSSESSIYIVHSDEKPTDRNPIAQSLQNLQSPRHDQSLPSGRDVIDTQNQDDRISLGSSPEAEESKPMTPEERDHWQRWLNGEFDPDRDKPLKVIDCHDLLDEDDEEEAIENESHPLDKSRKTPPHSPPSHAAAARSQPTAQYELAPNSPVSANPASFQNESGQIPLEIPSIASEAILEAEEKRGRSRKADEPSSEQLGEEFEQFWKLYPRKLNKSKAKAKFILHRKKGVPFQGMMQMLEICVAKEWEGRDMEYIPHPTTWINGERWIELEDIAIEIEREKAAAKAIADQEIRDRSAKLALACYREKPYRNLHFYFPLKHHVDLWTDTETKRKVFGTTRRLARPVLADWWNNLKAIGLDAIADMKILPVNEGHRLEIFGEPWKHETRTLAFSDYEGEETYFELVKKYHPFVLEQMTQERSHIDPKALTPEESAALLDEVLERSRQAAVTHTVRSGWGKRIEPILEEAE